MTAAPTHFPCLARIGVLCFFAALTACGGGGGSGGELRCTEDVRKSWLLEVTEDWYLFPETLPQDIDPDGFASPQALLDFLTRTAREEGKDRNFSYLTTRAADQSFFGGGQFVGFGLRTHIEGGSRLWIVEVFEGSPAAAAGLARGAEITAIDAGDGFRPLAEWLAEDPDLETALGPAEEGVTRGLRYTLGGATNEVSLTKRLVTIDPVPDVGGAAILPLAGTAGVGYLNLRTFVSTADAQLRQAFDEFRIAGLTDFVIDLRYNGGGLVATTELLGDLLGGARSTSDVFSQTRFNAARAPANDEIRRFRDDPAAVAPVRIAFLTTDSTASASELLINSMAPWVEIAIVGQDTFGKPVGQSAFDLSGCQDRLRLVTFRTDNALDQGSYFDGLAPTLPFACSAADDLSRPQGDPGEAMTAAALDWLATGQCGVLIGAEAALPKPSGATATAAKPAAPERPYLPGVY